ncbi:uncharacterized protein LOC119439913 [Dermacentor silvarum]|uniref:uncharacterized protein LOC119439913 n=1 Tax=Dermacentor silvarum TaxID=543639 RepID=UPI001898E03F|nr:uncharacterized protein LOC119439913 [Dermacentor silvarum]
MVVVAGDLNAKHSNWGGGITDARGAAVMQLACQCDLHVLNDPTSDPTFATAYTESWIDVTLASSAMISRGHEWAVLEDLTLSDHRLVEFSFPFARPPPRKKLTFQGKADLLRQLAGEPWFDAVTRAHLCSGAALDAVLEKFYLTYTSAHARHLRNTKGGPHRANAWWTPELGSERGRVRAMRRKYQRARDPDMRAELRDVFAAARAQYRAHIRDAQECALRRYCTECSKKSIFGAPFRAAFGKARPPVVLPALRAPGGRLTSDTLSSASLLLRTQVSLDDVSTDTAEHAAVRAIAAAPAVTLMDDRPFTTEEVEHHTVTYRCHTGEVSAHSTLGSPQGSPISPLLWNIVISGLLDVPMPPGVAIQAYADDTVLVMPGESRAAIERTAALALQRVAEWSSRSKVRFLRDLS